jgi:tetratricopeptide (TPR) repeat protein
MTLARICIVLAAILAFSDASEQATAQPQQSQMEIADRLFQTGKFADAGEIYAGIASKEPKNYAAIRQLGRIALLSNRLVDARKWLEMAIALRPDDADTKVMLAAAFYRLDDFQNAAASLSGVDVSSNKLLISQYPTLNVAKLESFKGQTPYDVQGDGQLTRVKFLKTDPLPLISVRVNGSEPVTFFIDTGGSEVTLDTDFARELGIPQFGSVEGTFSGGQNAAVQIGRIDSFTMGDWTLKNLPVAVLALRQLSEGFGVKRIDGVIGTNLLYHFLATLDYPNGELILRRKNSENLKQFVISSSKRIAVPFWIASDHFMVAWGRVNTMQPTLLFIDSGLAGAGVKLAQSVIKEAGIKLEESKASEGAGGGGKLRLVPYSVRQVSLGDVRENDVQGLYDGPFPWEDSFGFHLAGMVGHEFLKPYAVTFDFDNMQIYLQ